MSRSKFSGVLMFNNDDTKVACVVFTPSVGKEEERYDIKILKFSEERDNFRVYTDDNTYVWIDKEPGDESPPIWYVLDASKSEKKIGSYQLYKPIDIHEIKSNYRILSQPEHNYSVIVDPVSNKIIGIVENLSEYILKKRNTDDPGQINDNPCSDTKNLFDDKNCYNTKTYNTPYGNIHVLEFLPGGVLYSGNSTVYVKNTNIPIGGEYYSYKNTPEDQSELDKYIEEGDYSNVQSAVTSLPSINPKISYSWYGTYKTALIYASSSKKTYECNTCVMAFKIVKTLPLFILGSRSDGDYTGVENILTLLNYFLMTKNTNTLHYLLGAFFRIFKTEPNDVIEQTEKILKKDIKSVRDMIIRTSFESTDKEMVNAFIKERKGIFGDIPVAGYCAEIQKIGKPSLANYGAKPFHEEYCVWNAALYLERDFSNPFDYMYNPELKKITSPIINNWLLYMSKFNTFNVFKYQGNYLDHAMWATLYSEDRVKDLYITKPKKMYDFYVKVSISAFLHDIGKLMLEYDTIKTFMKKRYIAYFNGDTTKAHHGYLGASMVLFDIPIEFGGITLNLNDLILDLTKLTNTEDSFLFVKWLVAFICWNHNDVEIAFDKRKIIKYIQDIWWIRYLQIIKQLNPEKSNDHELIHTIYRDFVVILFIVASSNISGYNTYSPINPIGNTRSRLTEFRISIYLPFVQSRPQVYPGSSNSLEKAKRLWNLCLSFIRSRDFDTFIRNDIVEVEYPPKIYKNSIKVSYNSMSSELTE